MSASRDIGRVMRALVCVMPIALGVQACVGARAPRTSSVLDLLRDAGYEELHWRVDTRAVRSRDGETVLFTGQAIGRPRYDPTGLCVGEAVSFSGDIDGGLAELNSAPTEELAVFQTKIDGRSPAVDAQCESDRLAKVVMAARDVDLRRLSDALGAYRRLRDCVHGDSPECVATLTHAALLSRSRTGNVDHATLESILDGPVMADVDGGGTLILGFESRTEGEMMWCRYHFDGTGVGTIRC